MAMSLLEPAALSATMPTIDSWTHSDIVLLETNSLVPRPLPLPAVHWHAAPYFVASAFLFIGVLWRCWL
jgi:hypothetical protein